MAFFDRVKSFLGFGGVHKSFSLTELARVASGPRGGSGDLQASYLANPAYRMVSGRIAQSVGATEWKILTRSERSTSMRSLRGVARKNLHARKAKLARLVAQKELEEIDDHDFLALLASPNHRHTGVQLMQMLSVWLSGEGDGGWWFKREGVSQYDQICPVPPTSIVRFPETNNGRWEIKDRDGQTVNVEPKDFVYFSETNPAQPWGRGAGIGRALADELDIDENAARHVGSFFHNSAMPNFLISVDGLNPEQMKAAEARFEDKHRGVLRRYLSHFTNRKFEVQRLDTSFRDMELVALRKAARDQIIHTFGVPPEVVGIVENSNRATITAAETIFAKYVIEPRLETIRSFLQPFIERAYGTQYVLEYDSPVPRDLDFELEAARAHPDSLTVNEWRELQGNVPVEGGDVFEDESPNEPPPEAEPQRMLPAKKGVIDNAMMVLLVERLDPEFLRRHAVPTAAQLIEAIGESELMALGVDTTFNAGTQFVIDQVDAFSADRIAGINATTRDAIRDQLRQSIALDEGREALVDRLKGTMGDASDARVRMIAQTEVAQLSNMATHEAHRQSGIVRLRRWAVADGMARATHLELEGVIKSINEPFTSSSGASAMYPGGFGVAEEDINCRCITVPVFDDKAMNDRVAQQTKVAQSLLNDWTKRMEASFRAGFDAQLSALLEVVDNLR